MVLSVRNLYFSYGNHEVITNLSFDLKNGVYGLLGPNGAGKTTLINLIVKLLTPKEGTILLNEHDIHKLKNEYFDYIGYLPQYPKFYPNFTALEFLHYMAACKGLNKKEYVAQVEELLEFVNLKDVKNKKIKSFSGGMRQRLGIAQTLLGNPQILILDEPTAGLDPKERIRFRNLISKIGENHIILFATHIVSDIESISKEVIVIDKGEIRLKDSPSKLISSMNGKVWEYEISEAYIDSKLLSNSVSNIRYEEDKFIVRQVCEFKPAENASSVHPMLEDIYVFLFGGNI